MKHTHKWWYAVSFENGGTQLFAFRTKKARLKAIDHTPGLHVCWYEMYQRFISAAYSRENGKPTVWQE